MQIQEAKDSLEVNGLTITQKLAFLIESIPQTELGDLYQERYPYAIIGSCLADLLMMKKISLVDNKIIIANSEKTNYEYLNRFLNELVSSGMDMTMLDSFSKLKVYVEELEELIKKDLIQRHLLSEKREGLPFIGHKVTYPVNKESLDKLLEKIRANLSAAEENDESMLYLIALLDTIGLLTKAFESKKEFDYGQKRIETLIENDHSAKLICRAIDNEIKLEDLKHMKSRSGSKSSLF